MSLLVALPGVNADALASHPLATAAGRVAAAQGHGRPESLSWPGGSAWWFATPDNPGHGGACVRVGERFAACVGTPVWDGTAGEALMQRWLARFQGPASLPWMEVSGSFALLIGGPEGAWLFNDAIGLQKVYRRRDGALYSTSMLAVRGTVAQPSLRRLRAQEYVLLGANHALETPFSEVDIVDPTQGTRLDGGRPERVVQASAWRAVPENPTTLDSAAEHLASRIATGFRGLVQAHRGPVGMALSGGFDSRLLLAALDHIGTTPTLYVYGRPADEDVQVAVAKARELELPIEAIDKSVIDADRPAFGVDALRTGIAFFDGLPVDGALDRGSDRLTRQRQMAGGRLNLNGGGGEILRNFFYLPEGRYSASDLVGTFYSNWLPTAIPDATERQAFVDATADGILASLELEGGHRESRRRALSRGDVERVYTLFRLRFWMGRNNSVAAQHGAFATPLVHPAWIAMAAALPLHWKTFGDLESAIIRRLSPRVAAGPSSYGFDFGQGPSAAHRRRVRATLLRPVALRRRSARIRHLLGRLPAVPCPPEWAQASGPDRPDWIDPAGLTDRSQWNRLCTLQAMCSSDWDPPR